MFLSTVAVGVFSVLWFGRTDAKSVRENQLTSKGRGHRFSFSLHKLQSPVYLLNELAQDKKNVQGTVVRQDEEATYNEDIFLLLQVHGHIETSPCEDSLLAPQRFHLSARHLVGVGHIRSAESRQSCRRLKTAHWGVPSRASLSGLCV